MGPTHVVRLILLRQLLTKDPSLRGEIHRTRGKSSYGLNTIFVIFALSQTNLNLQSIQTLSI